MLLRIKNSKFAIYAFICACLVINIKSSTAQYNFNSGLNSNYYADPSLYNFQNDIQFRSGGKQDQFVSSQFQQDIEQKYVNSGQSVMLVCDLPNNMPDGKVMFVKYDSQVLSSGIDIRDDGDDERFEIGQQYAWEWSLKINSINEEDSGIYFCKVGNVVIKKFEIIVKVPPRIKDDPRGYNFPRFAREGDSIELSCFASGTPKPNITWYLINNDLSVKILPQTGNYLKLENVTRNSARRYQCRASNNIPPSDTRNFTFSINFAPEIEIKSKLDYEYNAVTLNCTINANPLTNSYFWKKDGIFLNNGLKFDIQNIRTGEYEIISRLDIKNFNDQDSGLYECNAENDVKITKSLFSLKYDPSGVKNMNLIPIGNSNDLKANSSKFLHSSTKQHNKNRKNNKQHKSSYLMATNHNQKNNNFENGPSDSVYSSDTNQINKSQRKHLRNQRNLTKSSTTLNKFGLNSETTTNYHNSPYIILLNDDSSLDNSLDDNGSGQNSNSLNKSIESSSLSNYSNISGSIIIFAVVHFLRWANR